MRIDAASPSPGASSRTPPPPDDRPRAGAGLKIAGVVIVALAALVVVSGLLSRRHDTTQVKTWTSAQEIPAVNVVEPARASAGQALVLPGNLQAFYNAPIYSRVSGYVRAWYFDIGARVKTGQLLATIDTPELDQQIQQARADMASAQANMQLAQTTAQRWTRLLAQDAVSKQESDEKTGDLAAKTAQVNASKANVDRLIALKSFARIVAPFDGVITARKTDIGALVNAGAGATPNSELFDVAKIDRLRLYVHVPQADSARIIPGVNATLTVPEYPGQTFLAALDTTSNAVSDNTGTLLVELLVNNPAGQLKAGDYAQVRFQFPSTVAMNDNQLSLPSSALLFRNKGMEAAVVGPDDHVHLRRLGVGRNLGSTIEVTSGVTPTDRVINNPPDSIADGQLVRVVQTDAKPSSGGADAAG